MYALMIVPLFAFSIWPPDNLALHACLAAFVWCCSDGLNHGWNHRLVAARAFLGDRRGFIQNINCLLEDLALAFASGCHEWRASLHCKMRVLQV